MIMDCLQREANLGKITVPFPLIKCIDYQPAAAAAAILQALNINISPSTVVYTECPLSIHYYKFNDYFTECEGVFKPRILGL
jgi:hypothetical protein